MTIEITETENQAVETDQANINAQIEANERISSENNISINKMERPDYFPEDLWDSEKGQPKLEDVYKKLTESEKRIEGFRKVLSDKKSFEKYKEEEAESISEEYKFDEDIPNEELDDEDKNTLLHLAKTTGLNNQQLNTFTKTLIEKAKETTESFKQSELSKLGPDAEKLIKNIDAFVDARVKSKTFSEEESKAMFDIINKGGAAGIRAFAKVIEMTGEKPIPVSIKSHSDYNTLRDTKEALFDALKRSGGKENSEIREIRERLEKFN